MEKRTKIIALIESVSGKRVPAEPAESLFEAGVLDSFGLADFVAALEKEFGVKIPDEDLNPRKFDSIERIEAYLESRQ